MDRKVNPSIAETVASESLMGNHADEISRATSAAAEDEGRFVPGTLLGGRYRIIGLLGRGGMGEGYRATHLTLGQSVALKFLIGVGQVRREYQDCVNAHQEKANTCWLPNLP